MRKLFKTLVATLAMTTMIGSAFAATSYTSKGDGSWGTSYGDKDEIKVEADVTAVDKVVIETEACEVDDIQFGVCWGEAEADQAKLVMKKGDTSISADGLAGKMTNGFVSVQSWWIPDVASETAVEGIEETKFDWGSRWFIPVTVTVKAVKYYHKDGKEVTFGAETPAENPTPDAAAPTGDATSVIALGAVALLALAGVVYTKKNA